MRRLALLALGARLVRCEEAEDGANATNATIMTAVYVVVGNTTLYTDDNNNMRANLDAANAAFAAGILFLASITDRASIQSELNGDTYYATFVITRASMELAGATTDKLRGLDDNAYSSARQIMNEQVQAAGASFQFTDEDTLRVGNYTRWVEPPDTSCPVYCCNDALTQEVQNYCNEFLEFKLKQNMCNLWIQTIQARCRSSCSDIAAMDAEALEQCTFHMNTIESSYTVARTKCKYTMVNWRLRSRSVCNITEPDGAYPKCHSYEGKACAEDCANFQGCHTYLKRGTPIATSALNPEGFPMVTVGKTVLRGQIPGRMQTWSCDITPDYCRNYKDTRCGPYKWCPVDYCILNNVSCPPLDACRKFGDCEPLDGQCYYSTEPNGASCEDGIFYTLDSTCQNGKCVGFTDKCMKYGVECETLSPCLYSPGGCDASTGHCVFVPKPEGTSCAVEPSSSTRADGECQDGLCRRLAADRCQGVICNDTVSDADPCYFPSVCDEAFGACIHVQRREGWDCDDGDAETENDRCIEGACRGDLVKAPSYEQVGIGTCITVSGKAIPQYYIDVDNGTVCEDLCNRDPVCDAYGYHFPVCSMYSTRRTRAPDFEHWNRTFAFGTDLPNFGTDNFSSDALVGEAVLSVENGTGDLPMFCKRRGYKSKAAAVEDSNLKQIWLAIVLSIFLLMPIVAFLLFGGFCRFTRLNAKIAGTANRHSTAVYRRSMGVHKPPRSSVKGKDAELVALEWAPQEPMDSSNMLTDCDSIGQEPDTKHAAEPGAAELPIAPDEVPADPRGQPDASAS